MVSTYNRIIKHFVFLLSDWFLLVERVDDFRERKKGDLKSNINLNLLVFQTCV